jgi:hypothetical protein
MRATSIGSAQGIPLGLSPTATPASSATRSSATGSPYFDVMVIEGEFAPASR